MRARFAVIVGIALSGGAFLSAEEPLEVTGHSSGLELTRISCKSLSSHEVSVVQGESGRWSAPGSPCGLGSADRVSVVAAGWVPALPSLEPADGDFGDYFTVHVTHDTDPLSTFAGLEVADLDGDGDEDVITGSRFVWFENLGGVPPLFKKHLFSPETIFASDPKPIDIDGDGDIDIATVQRTGAMDYKLVWFANSGGPRPEFQERKILEFKDAFPEVIGGDDLDGDGDGDLFATQSIDNGTSFPERKTLVWLENRGRAPWLVHSILSVSDSNFVAHPVDADGDLDLDIVVVKIVAGSEDRTTWFENHGAVFGPEQPLISDFFALNVVGVDMDLDGDGDMVVGGLPGNEIAAEVRWFENVPGIGYREHEVFALENTSFRIVVGDITGNGRPDVVATKSGPIGTDQNLFTWLENLPGTPIEFVTHRQLLGGADFPFVATDLDGDQRLDILNIKRGNLRWYENRVGVSLSVSGLLPTSFECRNLTTGAVLAGPLEQPRADCQALGLSFAPGDVVEIRIEGVLP